MKIVPPVHSIFYNIWDYVIQRSSSWANILWILSPRYGLLPHLATSIAADSGVSSSSPAPSSPLLSPNTWSHKWPTPAWQCFVDGVMIRFLLPSTDTPWQKAEELGLKDKLAMKVGTLTLMIDNGMICFEQVDARNPYRYAPNGLTVVKVGIVVMEDLFTKDHWIFI